METHISGSTDDVERRFLKLQSKNTDSDDSHFGEKNSAVFLLHHPLEQNFREFFLVSLFTFSGLHIFCLAQIREFKVCELQTGKI